MVSADIPREMLPYIKDQQREPQTPLDFAAEFHDHLSRNGMPDWTIYHADHGLGFAYGDDKLFKDIGCDDAVWKPMARDPDAAVRFCDLTHDERMRLRPIPAGWLLLPKWNVAIGRWHTFSHGMDCISQVHLYAARSIEDLQWLRDTLRDLKRKNQKPKWHVFCGEGPPDEIVRDEGRNWDSLILNKDLQDRIHRHAVEFFNDSTRTMYQQLGLPHRRGILLWEKPGNGKTSIIRVIASMNPGITAFCLQPSAGFNDECLKSLIDYWRMEAPSMLVIEDLDWMLSHSSVSTFLNLLDGVDRRCGGGQLLIATTNHPEKLDPAINNRPGRFDVAIEVPPPSRSLREQYFEKSLPDIDQTTRSALAAETDGLSFAHLREVLLAAGHSALQSGRERRSAEDFLAGASMVRSSNQIAEGGFTGSQHLAFGFGDHLEP